METSNLVNKMTKINSKHLKTYSTLSRDSPMSRHRSQSWEDKINRTSRKRLTIRIHRFIKTTTFSIPLEKIFKAYRRNNKSCKSLKRF